MLITLKKIKDNGIYEFLDYYDIPLHRTLEQMAANDIANKMGGYPVYARWSAEMEMYSICSRWDNPLEEREDYFNV